MSHLADTTGTAVMPLDIDLATIGVPALPAPPPHVDFQREVHAVLGLPIDAIDMADAVALVRHAAFSGTPCMISTPNLNFAVGALADPVFRASVTTSDLNLADGMPLVWVAKLLRVPIRRRVSGADLFEALAAHPEPAVTVFFFGGPDGAALEACRRLNATARGLRLAFERRWRRPGPEAWSAAGVRRETAGDTDTLTLAGPWARHNLQPLRDALTEAAATARRLRLVLRDVTHVDTAFVGLLMLAPRAF